MIAIRLNNPITNHIPGHPDENENTYIGELHKAHLLQLCLIIQYFFRAVFLLRFFPYP